MLPSKGLFASYFCPFFKQGSCERPYCHFHHRKKTKSCENRQSSKKNNPFKANHTKALEELKEINKILNYKVGRTEYSSRAIDNVLTYTPTPIAILNKRNTTGCNSYTLDKEEELIIKKQKTQICDGMKSGNDSGCLKQNIIVKNQRPDNSDSIIAFKQAENYDEGALNELSSILEGIQNQIKCHISRNSYAEEIPHTDNVKSCEQSFFHSSPIHVLEHDINKNFPNHSTDSNQTNLNFAVEDTQPQIHFASNNFDSTVTNLFSPDQTEIDPLESHGESVSGSICVGKNEKHFDHSVDEFPIENDIDGFCNNEGIINGSSIPKNETNSNNKQLVHTPRETYANIVKQERNYFQFNKNASQYGSGTYRKTKYYPISTKRITANNKNETKLDDNASKSKNYTKINKQLFNEDKVLNKVNHSPNYKNNSLTIPEEKSCNSLILDETVSHPETNEAQSSLIQSINVKHRIAHCESNEKIKSVPTDGVAKALPRCSPSQVLLERWRSANVETKKNNKAKETAPNMRIAYVPNVAALLAERQRITNSLAKSSSTKGNDSISCEKFSLLKKNLLVEFVHNSKIPIIKRQTFLNKALEVYCQLYTYDTAKSKAVEVEKEICLTSKSSTLYFNRFAQLFMRLKKEIASKNRNDNTDTENINPEKTEEANRIAMYNDLLKYIIYDLEDNGIPVPHPEKSGFARMKKIYGVSSYNKSKSICIYCLKEFEVDSKGYSIETICKFHSGKKYKKIRKYGIEKIWNCCNGDEESGGCVKNEFHVRDMVDYDNIPGFKQVREPTVSFKEACQVYAMDCEMCYTTEGSELTRCTVVDINLKVVYDKLCVPDLPIIDYCTKFSGISKGDLDNVSTKLSDIQADLLNLFTTETILIGHGIGNDLKAVKLFHRSIIDTKEVYGNFRKHKLSELAREILQREIQVSGSGHNSCEDAIATMELMLVKVNQDRKASMPRS